jgi:succinoglycan biosynthesis transport protein ExoP
MKKSRFLAASPARAYWLFAGGLTLVGGLAGTAVSLAATPQYLAHARVYVSTSGGESGNTSYQDAVASQQSALSLARLMSSEVVTERVVQSMKLSMSPSDLASKMTATVEPETVLINLTVINPSPTEAREIANTTALEFSEFVKQLPVTDNPMAVRPQVTLVQPAVTPSGPISPNTLRNLGLGALAGLGAGLALANLRNRADGSVRDVRELEHFAGEPPLGSIPTSSNRDGKLLDVVTKDQNVLESFKEVRTNLQHALDDRPSRIVCVTSAGTREGKTATVIGMALALSDAGHRVVVVDSDLRDADLSNQLGLGDTDGLTELLSNELEVDAAIHPSGLPRIDAVSSGVASRQPSELLNSEKAAVVFRLLGERYDYVLVDTPALLAFTDGAVVADHMDGVVLVARWAYVESADIESAVANLRRVDATVLGPIFTFTPLSEARRTTLRTRRGIRTKSRPRPWHVSAKQKTDRRAH